MKCQKCGMNIANVRYSQNINGRKSEICLCSECAQELNLLKGFENNFRFDSMFSNFFEDFGGLRLLQMPKLIYTQEVEPKKYKKDFYDKTNPELDEALKNIINKKRNMSEKEKLEEELKKCIEKENYERAAEIRDKLKNM